MKVYKLIYSDKSEENIVNRCATGAIIQGLTMANSCKDKSLEKIYRVSMSNDKIISQVWEM